VSRRVSRRAFLALCGAAGAAGATAGVWKLVDGEERDWRPTARRLGAAFSDAVAARAVGNAYLASNPRERDGRRLVARLRAASSDWSRVRRSDDVRRLAAVEVRRDYEAGRIANAGGWMLSLTEARLCGLAVLVEREKRPA
jgi:hypothetical protein